MASTSEKTNCDDLKTPDESGSQKKLTPLQEQWAICRALPPPSSLSSDEDSSDDEKIARVPRVEVLERLKRHMMRNMPTIIKIREKARRLEVRQKNQELKKMQKPVPPRRNPPRGARKVQEKVETELDRPESPEEDMEKETTVETDSTAQEHLSNSLELSDEKFPEQSF